jgi:hypothetical protein
MKLLERIFKAPKPDRMEDEARKMKALRKKMELDVERLLDLDSSGIEEGDGYADFRRE